MSNAIFAATSRHAEWLAVRRTVIAENVANASTPGYRARETAAFSLDRDTSPSSIVKTHAVHLDVGQLKRVSDASPIESAVASHSENTVDLEQQMMQAGEVARGQALNAALTRSFHRMALLSVRG